jgi:hypothetical protein
MREETALKHEFVPDDFKEGRFTSRSGLRPRRTRLAAAAAAGFVTLLRPTGWKLIFDGETISLRPSIGKASPARLTIG